MPGWLFLYKKCIRLYDVQGLYKERAHKRNDHGQEFPMCSNGNYKSSSRNQE
jgi:hypothetical protein